MAKENEFSSEQVLAVLDLASKKGLKFDFDGDGHYESLEDLVSGKDGDALASWAINKEMPNGLSMKSLPAYISSGAKISFAKCKPGDLLIKHTERDKHIYIVIKNGLSFLFISIALSYKLSNASLDFVNNHIVSYLAHM